MNGLYNLFFINKKCEAVSFIQYDGFISAKDKFCTVCGDGEHYVYLWKHITGDAFYVGSGKGERWINIHSRNMKFFAEIDKGDAVVYKIISGLTKEEARKYEYLLSAALSKNSKLTNEDYPHNLEEWLKKNEIDSQIETKILNAIIEINADEDFSYKDKIKQDKFLEEFGKTYFTDKNTTEYQR